VDAVLERGGVCLVFTALLPDLNPIELVWSKVKAILRKLKTRTHEDLQAALKIALAAVTLGDIKNWFKHDGYNC
jgi:transposase